MTRNNNTGLRLGDWNEHNAKALARTHWRASLVPAAAVIPAPVAYIKVVAVKKLVVGRLSSELQPVPWRSAWQLHTAFIRWW